MSEATAEQTRGRRKTLIGTVVSVKMDKTAVVAVERRYPHPLYHKIVRKTKRYKVHDPNNSAVLGDSCASLRRARCRRRSAGGSSRR